MKKTFLAVYYFHFGRLFMKCFGESTDENESCQIMKRLKSFPQKKKLFLYYDDELLRKECPCIHKTSTPVRADFDLYEDIIFLPANNLPGKDMRSDDAFIQDATHSQTLCVLPTRMKRRLRKVKRSSKAGARAALTLILCNIL